jgi:hypothetical protein
MSAPKDANAHAFSHSNDRSSEYEAMIAPGSYIVQPGRTMAITRCVRPNAIHFTDDNGVKHRIYIPTGKFKQAMKLFEEKNWEELQKYPVYSKFERGQTVLKG